MSELLITYNEFYDSEPGSKQEEDCFSLFCEVFYNELNLFTVMLCDKNVNLAHETLNETLLKILGRKELKKERIESLSYMKKMLKTTKLDLIRDLGRRGWGLTDVVENLNILEGQILIDPISDLFRDLDHMFFWNRVKEILDNKLYKTFELFHFEGRKKKEISDILNISVDAVKSRLTKAMRIIREDALIKEYSGK